MDVKVQDAKWFYFIVSLAIILRGKKQQIPFRSKSLLSPPTLQHLCFQESKYLKLSASNNTHQYKEFLVSNFEEANNGSFSSPIGWGIRNKYQLSEKGRVKKRERGGGVRRSCVCCHQTRCRGDLWRVTLPEHTFPFCKVWIMMLFISLSFVIMINLGNVCNDAF